MRQTPIFCLLQDEEVHCIDNIYRFNKQPVIRNETLSSHSWWVQFFALNLFGELFNVPEEEYDDGCAINAETIMYLLRLKLDIIQYAALHDFVETVTGDVNHELKYNDYNGKELKKVLDKYEKAIEGSYVEDYHLKHVGAVYQRKTVFVAVFVKVCDWLALFKNVKQEISLGNKGMNKVVKNGKEKMLSSIHLLISHCKHMNEKDANLCNIAMLEKLMREIEVMVIY